MYYFSLEVFFKTYLIKWLPERAKRVQVLPEKY